MFVKVNGIKSMNLQDIQMGADVASDTTDLQVLDESQLTTETYQWFKNRTDGKVGPSGYRIDVIPGTNGAWFLYDEDNDEYTFVADREFDYGDCVQISSFDGATTTFAGAVTDEDVLFADASAAREGFNYYGNPYPQAINIQDIQMGADVASDTTDLQVLDESQLTTETYQWFKNRTDGKVGPSGYRVDVVEGTNGAWFLYDEDNDEYQYADPSDPATKKTFAAGEGFQISTFEDAEVTILAPFEL